MPWLATLIALFSVTLRTAISLTSCTSQTISEPGITTLTTLGLDLRNASFRNRRAVFETRSIVQCRSEVEVLDVPEGAVAYDGVPLGGIVTIVETTLPLLDTESVQAAVPACTGVFVSETQIISSAHCVYHQKQDTQDSAYWIYGDSHPRKTYLYALAGRVSSSDSTYDVYPLQRACIPQSYISATNESITSGQGNDITVFSTSQFNGAPSAIAKLAETLVYDVPREYLLPQYPSDVDGGTRLVIDTNEAVIERRPLAGGWFETVELVSWSGSSGGPVVDITATREEGRPVVVAVLMSSGWEVCDSGVVRVTRDVEVVEELLRRSKRGAGGSESSGNESSSFVEPVDDGFVALTPPPDLRTL